MVYPLISQLNQDDSNSHCVVLYIDRILFFFWLWYCCSLVLRQCYFNVRGDYQITRWISWFFPVSFCLFCFYLFCFAPCIWIMDTLNSFQSVYNDEIVGYNVLINRWLPLYDSWSPSIFSFSVHLWINFILLCVGWCNLSKL